MRAALHTSNCPALLPFSFLTIFSRDFKLTISALTSPWSSHAFAALAETAISMRHVELCEVNCSSSSEARRCALRSCIFFRA